MANFERVISELRELITLSQKQIETLTRDETDALTKLTVIQAQIAVQQNILGDLNQALGALESL